MIGLVDVNNCFVSCERVFNRSLVGRPVAVLSNNDGCCVARSNEFKALGIAMGTPYFQLKNREKSGELVFCSSNYELYGDMSRRLISILRDEALDRYIEEFSAYPFAQSHLTRLRHTSPDFPSTRQEKEDFLRVMKTVTDKMGNDFGSCALCSRVTLAPGEKKTICGSTIAIGFN